jgi:hypothetical protein
VALMRIFADKSPSSLGLPEKMGMERILHVLCFKFLKNDYLSAGIGRGFTLPQSGPL